MNKKTRKLIYILIVIFPFLDLITSFLTRTYNLTVTPGVIVKGLFMLLLLFYILISKSKYKKASIIAIILFGLYIIGYFGFKIELLSKVYFLTELVYLFKLFYFPIIFLGLLCFYDDNKFDKKEIIDLLKINLISITILLIIPLLFHNAYTTYPEILKGYIGWYYAGNEVANIMIILAPFMYYYITNKKYTFLISLVIIFAILQIGTKVSWLGILIVTFITFIYSIFYTKSIKKNPFISCLLILVFTFMLSANCYAYQNYKYMISNKYTPTQKIVIDKSHTKEVKHIKNKLDDFYKKNEFTKLLRVLLNGRDEYLANTLSIYDNIKDDSNIWFGIGFSNTPKIDNSNITKLIEIDILDAYFHFGVLGLLIMMSPLLMTLFLMLISKKRLTLYASYLCVMILLMCGISSFSGHFFMSPAVAIYVVLYLLILLNEFDLIGRNTVLKDKISILSLHLGYGGIEKSIVNQANMISEKYETEIICLYKLNDKIPYEVSKNVNIVYLSDLKPNKEEFLSDLHSHHFLKMFNEGFKSVYILYMKKHLISKYIYNSDSKIIISTRIEFTALLNKYGNTEAIKIAEEHVYHKENKKYINKLNKALKNIDYLIPASKYLTKDYKKYITNTEVIYIPQTIDYYPKTKNKLNNKNIISVGRLVKSKGYEELIEIFKLIAKNNKDVKLTVAGDGIEKDNLKQMIKHNKLSKEIKLTGFLTSKELIKEYSKASLFVMTSYEESFGLVLLEAMSYGIPCIAYDSALGAKEIIDDKITGYIIKNRNQEDMVKAISDLLNNKKELNTLGKNAREKAKLYTCNNVKKEWHKFLEGVLK